MLGINKQQPNNVDIKYRLFLVYIISAICGLPLLLNFIGYDFSSTIVTLSKNSIISGADITNDLFKAVSGAMHHALLEWSAVVLAVTATLISFIHYKVKRDVTVPIIGLALLCAGLVDIFHTLAATRIISASAPNNDFIPFTWAISRIFNSSIMLLAALISLWLSQRLTRQIKTDQQLIIILAAALLFSVLSADVVLISASSDSLPRTMFPHALISRPYDILPLALFLCSGVFFWIWYNEKASILRFALFIAIIPAVATQLHMAFGSVTLFDNHFNIAHFLKNIAYGTILLGILLDLVQPSTKAKLSRTTDQAEENQRHDIDININKVSTDNEILSENKLSPASQYVEVDNKVTIGKVKWPLSFKIPVAGFLLSLVISLIIGFIFYFESQQLVLDKEIKELSLETKILTPMITNIYQQGELDVTFLRGTPPIQGILTAYVDSDPLNLDVWQKRLKAIFVELLKTKANYKRISYIKVQDSTDILVSAIRENGEVIALANEQLKTNVTLDSLAPMLASKENKTYYSKLTISQDKNLADSPVNSGFFISIPVFDIKSSSLFGLIAIEVDLSQYLLSLKTSVLKEIKYYVAGNNGEIIASPSKDPLSNSVVFIQDKFPHLAESVHSSVDNATFYDHQNTLTNSSIGYYAKVYFPQYPLIEPLHLLVENNDEAFHLAIQNMRYRAILIAVSLSLLSLVLSIFAARRLIKPLADMSRSILTYDKLGKIGHLPIMEKDEIGLLARSFHNLLISLDQKSAEQKRAAYDAHNSSLKLQAILNSIVDAVITIDTQGKILAINKSARQMFGYQDDEVINQNISILMPMEFSRKHDEYLRHYLMSGESKIIGVGRELPALRKDGETFPMHLSISSIETVDGVIYTGLIRDITKDKLLDAENKRILQETNNVAWRLNFALSAPQIGVWEIDLLSGRLHWDERMYRLFGYQADEGLTPKEVWKKTVHPEDRAETDNKILDFIKAGERLKYHHRIILPNGDIRYIEGHAQVMLDEKGNKAKIVGTNRDNTEQHQIQALKQQALDMAEESLRLKSEFLASMSHEIRTPMNGVLGMLGLLDNSDLNKKQKHYLQLANSSAHSLLSLINDILDFSKIEAGKLDLEIIDFDIRTLIGELAESMAVRAQDKNIELVLDLTEIHCTKVKGDPSRLRQILSNLVGNSIKFTTSGEIVIKASISEVNEPSATAQAETKDQVSKQLKLTCTISDTGIGIPENKITTLFDSFTQVDATTTRKYGGTGLGLAIVKQLCELMGGKITVQSKLHQGSCFTFSIMLDSSYQSTLVLPVVDITDIDVLIVDDNLTNLEVLKGQLEIWGAKVTQAKDAYEAINIVEKECSGKFKVAIIDMQMPGMNGAQLGKVLNNHNKSDKMKLIMMTSMSERGDAAYFANLGFSAYFPKPATTSDLFDALAVVIDDSEVLQKAQPLVTHDYLSSISKSAHSMQLPKKSRILIAEDNRINQAVILGILANLELSADVANNGQEVIDILNNSAVEYPYEFIIMDCQMPELDGYQATKKIRQGEAGGHYKNIPILAMTANAMVGDKERCLDAGMNDYATKPVDAQILQAKLCHWVGERGQSVETLDKLNNEFINDTQVDLAKTNETINAHFNHQDESSQVVVWQQAAFLKRIRNNQVLAEKLIDLFLTDSPQLVEDLVLAIENKLTQEIMSLAHKLKGSVKNLGGQKLSQVVELLEYSHLEENFEDINELKCQLVKEFDIFISELKKFTFDLP